MTLFQYLVETIVPRLNNREGEVWLPRLLSGMEKEGGGKLLPLFVKETGETQLSDPEGVMQSAFYDSWYSLIEAITRSKKIPFDSETFVPIAFPDDPYPYLNMKNITISGLNNMILSQKENEFDDQTYYQKMLTDFNGYADQERLVFVGEYEIHITVCAADAGDLSKPTNVPMVIPDINWPVETIVGTGEFAMYIEDLLAIVDLDASVSGNGTDRKLRGGIRKIELSGPAGKLPRLQIDEDRLTIHSKYTESMVNNWKTAVLQAFASSKAAVSIMKVMQQLANDNQKELSRFIEPYVDKLLDEKLGSVIYGKLPSESSHDKLHPADQYLLDRLSYSAQSPGGTLYLPSVLSTLNLDPLTIGTINLSSFQIMGIDFTNVRLNKILVKGMQSGLLQPDGLYMEDGFMNLEIIIPRLLADGDLVFSLMGEEIIGSIGIEFEPALFLVNSQITANGAKVFVSHKSLLLSAEYRYVRLKLELESIFLDLINEYINKETEIKQKILESVNGELKKHLSEISEATNKKIKELL